MARDISQNDHVSFLLAFSAKKKRCFGNTAVTFAVMETFGKEYVAVIYYKQAW